jgi:hypothetical protein
MHAATPGIQNTLRLAPLSFETAADGSLVAHQGPCVLTLEAGRTTVTLTDRGRRRSATVSTRLAGARTGSRPIGENPLAAKASYFLGADPAAWRTGVPLFTRAVERGVYPGVDLVFHGDGESLEYDFVVHPGASAARIVMDVSGATALRIEPDGSLALPTPAGEIRWKEPEVYQWSNAGKDGARQPVRGAFAIHGHRVTFTVGSYDHGRDLIIDPTLAYATYFGGSDDDAGKGVAVDSSGNIYVTGFTFSTDLPVTAGAFQTAYHGGTAGADLGGDAFVAKYTPAGALVYVTYLGGSSDDSGSAIAVDSSGNAYLTGFTDSTDFPTTPGSIQTAFGGEGNNKYGQNFGDAFVAKLNPAGTALIYSTFLGGSNGDTGDAIAVDSSGNAYVGGTTLSTNFPTSNAYQAAYAGGGGGPPFCCGSNLPFVEFGDAFLAKLNPGGTALLFSTYFGGSLDETVTSLALDNSGNVYIAGSTISANFPLLNAYQNKFGGAAPVNAQPVITIGDGYVAKFNTSGQLQYSTYLGGSYDDAVMGVAVDFTGAAYVTGFTSSADFPVTSGAAQKNFTGPAGITEGRSFVWGDAFVAKLAPSGSSLIWSTYLGGTQDDAGMAIALDGSLNPIVGGFANSTDFPLTSNAQQPVFGGNGPPDYNDYTGDAFVAKVSADGSSFRYVSYYGGNSSDVISGIAVDGQANVIAVGATTSTNLPVTSNAAQLNYGGNGGGAYTEALGDAFLAVFAGVAVPSIVTNVTSSAANGTYDAGSSISIQVSFSQVVTVTGTPQLVLNSGGTAHYSAGTGTATLIFTYIVGASDSSAHLDYASTGALTLNGGAIQDAALHEANLTLAAPGASGSLGANTNIVISVVAPAAFFSGEVSLGSGVYYLQFPNGNLFGYYTFVASTIFYHYDMGYEGFIPGSASDLYLYDFTSGHWWYTSNTLFPYLYDFSLKTWVYYFPNTQSPGHYTANPRYFSNLTTGIIFTM